MRDYVADWMWRFACGDSIQQGLDGCGQDVGVAGIEPAGGDGFADHGVTRMADFI
ncbi:MAG: hypothetical protein O7G87_14005 [bacterium]|nr:hypothetical protein [bacterium]